MKKKPLKMTVYDSVLYLHAEVEREHCSCWVDLLFFNFDEGEEGDDMLIF